MICLCEQEAHAREVEELKRECSQAKEEAERRHASQLRALEERMATERQTWQESFTRRQENALLAREREMRESLRQERDKVGWWWALIGVTGVFLCRR